MKITASLKTSLALFLAFSLSLESFLPAVAQAQEETVIRGQSSVISKPSELLNYYPPSDLAQVTDSFYSPLLLRGEGGGEGDELVILIQDLHCHPGVQRKIAGLLAHYDSLGIAKESVFVEGAEGSVDTSPMALFPDEKIQKEVTEEFVDAGLFGGPEAYAVLHKKPAYLWGVETKKVYDLHREFFQKTFESRLNLAQTIQDLQKQLVALEPKVLSRSQRKFKEKQQAYQTGKLSLFQYLKYFEGEGPALSPELAAMLHLLDLERHLPDSGTLQQQTKDFLAVLSPRLTKEETDRLAHYAKNNATVYYLYLDQLAQRTGAFPAAGKALRDYLSYTNQKEHQDLAQFQRKLEEREQQFLLAQAETPLQKNLVQSEQDLSLLQDLIELKLTENQLTAFLSRTESLLALLKTLLPEENTATLQESIAQAADFYSLALMRDKPLIEKTLEKQENGTAILVTGGFHTSGIARILKEKGISYLTLSPNVESYTEEDQSRYRDVLLGKIPGDYRSFTTSENTLAAVPGAFEAVAKDTALRRLQLGGKDVMAVNPTVVPDSAGSVSKWASLVFVVGCVLLFAWDGGITGLDQATPSMAVAAVSLRQMFEAVHSGGSTTAKKMAKHFGITPLQAKRKLNWLFHQELLDRSGARPAVFRYRLTEPAEAAVSAVMKGFKKFERQPWVGIDSLLYFALWDGVGLRSRTSRWNPGFAIVNTYMRAEFSHLFGKPIAALRGPFERAGMADELKSMLSYRREFQRAMGEGVSSEKIAFQGERFKNALERLIPKLKEVEKRNKISKLEIGLSKEIIVLISSIDLLISLVRDPDSEMSLKDIRVEVLGAVQSMDTQRDALNLKRPKPIKIDFRIGPGVPDSTPLPRRLGILLGLGSFMCLVPQVPLGDSITLTVSKERGRLVFTTKTSSEWKPSLVSKQIRKDVQRLVTTYGGTLRIENGDDQSVIARLPDPIPPKGTSTPRRSNVKRSLLAVACAAVVIVGFVFVGTGVVADSQAFAFSAQGVKDLWEKLLWKGYWEGRFEVVKPFPREIRALVWDWDETIQHNSKVAEIETKLFADYIYGPDCTVEERRFIQAFVKKNHKPVRVFFSQAYALRKSRNGGAPIGSLDEELGQFLAGYDIEAIKVFERTRATWRTETPLVRGAEELLNEARQRGIQQSVASNLSEQVRIAHAEIVGLDHYFDGGIYGAESAAFDPGDFSKEAVLKKVGLEQALLPEEVLFLDDVPANIEAASKAGFMTIAVAHSRARAIEHKRAGANAIVYGDFREHEKIAKTIFRYPKPGVQLSLEPKAPVRHFLDVMGIDLRKAAMIQMDQDYGLIPVPEGNPQRAILDRYVKTYAHSLEPSNGLKYNIMSPHVRRSAWILVHHQTPLALLVKLTQFQALTLDLTPILSRAPGSVSEEQVPEVLEQFLHDEKHKSDFIKANYGGEILGREIYFLLDTGFRHALLETKIGSFHVPVFLDGYPPGTTGSQNLLNAALSEITDGQKVLVLGVGPGPELPAIATTRQVTLHATDNDPLAVANARATADVYDLKEPNVLIWQSDGFDEINGSYDTIVFHAMRPTTPDERHLTDSHEWDPKGKTIKKVFRKLSRHLNPGGRLLLMGHDDHIPILEKCSTLQYKSLMQWPVNELEKRDGSFHIFKITVKGNDTESGVWQLIRRLWSGFPVVVFLAALAAVVHPKETESPLLGRLAGLAASQPGGMAPPPVSADFEKLLLQHPDIPVTVSDRNNAFRALPGRSA